MGPVRARLGRHHHQLAGQLRPALQRCARSAGGAPSALPHRRLAYAAAAASDAARRRAPALPSAAAETGELQAAPAWVKPAGLTWPPSIQTNAFDLSFTFNLSMSDLLALNAGLAGMHTGARPALPCYPWDQPRLRARYYGSDVALGQLAGGHQRGGLPGVAGAMAAGRAAQLLPGDPSEAAPGAGAYTGSLAADGRSLVQPVYWFVDLLATFQVSSFRASDGQAACSSRRGCRAGRGRPPARAATPAIQPRPAAAPPPPARPPARAGHQRVPHGGAAAAAQRVSLHWQRRRLRAGQRPGGGEPAGAAAPAGRCAPAAPPPALAGAPASCVTPWPLGPCPAPAPCIIHRSRGSTWAPGSSWPCPWAAPRGATCSFTPAPLRRAR